MSADRPASPSGLRTGREDIYASRRYSCMCASASPGKTGPWQGTHSTGKLKARTGNYSYTSSK